MAGGVRDWRNCGGCGQGEKGREMVRWEASTRLLQLRPKHGEYENLVFETA